MEAQKIVEKYNIRLCMADIEKEELQHDSLEKIALHAAQTAFRILKKPLIVDDSGLFIESLNGFPGPYSSYVYKTIGYEGILKLMEDKDKRTACFKTVIALIYPPLEKLFIGTTCGKITNKARGKKGFGFDPIFQPHGYQRTYAEMTLEEKNKVSHRGKALRKMSQWLQTYLKAYK